MSYKAVVAKIYTSPHPNADKLKIGHICGFRVIVGLDTQDGDLYAYFDSDGQLSNEFAKANDLIRRKDSDGNHAGGFFEENRRVRCQPFRGVKSEGFAMPISAFAFTGYDTSLLTEGVQFDELNGVPICNKYVTKATAARIAQNAQIKNPLKAAFPQHYDTTQYRYANLTKGDLIVITEKEHGTSVRYGNVKVEVKPKWYYRFYGWLTRQSVTSHRDQYILGTRRAILNQLRTPYEFSGGYYKSGEPYNYAAQLLHDKLKPEEIVYGELVGYTSNNSPLFTHSLDKLPDLKKIYGSPMTYSYGCLVGKCRLRVYRITRNGRDLSWFEIIQRCKELEIEMVTELDRFIYDGDRDKLDAHIQAFLEGPSEIDSSHMREGVCVRVENEFGHRVYKEKSYSFKLAEGIVKDNDSYVDMEEVA